MAKVKVQFPITVKYQRVIYPPYTNILADTEDLPDMKKLEQLFLKKNLLKKRFLKK